MNVSFYRSPARAALDGAIAAGNIAVIALRGKPRQQWNVA
jgi:hypothetical protein